MRSVSGIGNLVLGLSLLVIAGIYVYEKTTSRRKIGPGSPPGTYEDDMEWDFEDEEL